ncbi:MAG: class I SAM-dependent methyltransferase [Vicinamibacterales bacterium]
MATPTAPINEMTEYWDAGFLAAEAKPGSFYDLKKLPAITQASHYRRMALLAGLPIGDVQDKVIVDYGVGPWGFACVFPALHPCREAIGIDLSPEAVRISEQLSRSQPFPYGDRVRYFTSTGSAIDLPDGSVDLVFAGESIEHVFNVDAFLDEVHRVLRPGGTVIITTPNADALLYKAHGERYCHNAEHVSLMTYGELRALVDPRFTVTVAKGFNGSFYRTFDGLADDAFAEAWTAAFEDRPDLATGIILMATPRPEYRPRPARETEFHHTSPAVRYDGEWDKCTLHGPLTAAVAKGPEAGIRLEFDGDGLVVFLWSHPWCSRVRLVVDGEPVERVVYSPVGGFVQQRWLDLAPGHHVLEMRSADDLVPEARGRNLMFWKAIALDRAAAAGR